VLPSVLQKLDLSADAVAVTGDDDEAFEIQYQGKLVKVKTERFEEMHQSAALLNSFCTEIEDSFFQYVGEVAKVLLGLLDCADEVSYLCEEARCEAFTTWSLLIDVATKSIPARGPEAQSTAQELLNKIVETCMKLLDQAQVKEQQKEDVEASELVNFASGISMSLQKAPKDSFPADKGHVVMLAMFKLIEASFLRTEKFKTQLHKSKEGAPPELQGDEDEEESDPLAEEESCRRSYEEVIGALMQNSPSGFLQYRQDFATQLQKWMTSKDNLVLALHFACDLLEHLKGESCQLWPVFMPQVVDGLHDKDPDVRTAASYAVNLAAGIPQFAEAAPEVFRRVAKLLTGPAPKKRDEKAKVAMDNCVAAMLSLGMQRMENCPPEVNWSALVVKKLPLKDDEEEAKKVHAKVVDLVIGQHPQFLGPNQENVGKILSVLAEIYKQDNISTKEIDEKNQEYLQRPATCGAPKQCLALYRETAEAD
jgi:hypothetical protein